MPTQPKDDKDSWWFWALLLLLLIWWWWRKRKPADLVKSTGTTVPDYTAPMSDPNNPPIFSYPDPQPTSTDAQDPPVQGASYYTQAASPRVEEITDASFDGINPANYAKLNAFPSSLVNYPGRGGAPRGVYDAVVWARASGENTAPYLAELNAALHSIYGA